MLCTAIKIWDLTDNWIATEDDDHAKAKLREYIRRFALTRRGKRRKLGNETQDRAIKVYTLHTARPIMRHQWLFAKMWVDESIEESEDENFDYHKREEKIRGLRIDALKEIWAARKFDGIIALLKVSGAASAVGWHFADGVKGKRCHRVYSAVPRRRRSKDNPEDRRDAFGFSS
jgi:hypothetical protein